MIFIRPMLLLLLFVPLVWLFIKRSGLSRTAWTKWVDANLLPYLLVHKDRTHSRLFGWPFFVILWCFFVIAAAGPAFQKLPVPTSNSLPNTVIIFDLGPAMQGSALATAKIKLHDLLTALKGNRVGLVLYADKGYTAVPLTEDRALVRSLIATLDPSVLPNSSQNLAAAFNQANQLIQQTGGKGRILYLTAGGVSASSVKTPYSVGVLGLDDSAISADVKRLGTYHARTKDSSDITTLLRATQPDTAIQFNTDADVDEWADLGGVIALLLLPFFAFTFRKGLLFLFLIGVFVPANAAFFLRPDQEAYQQQAQAVADYRAGNYDKAVQGFQQHAYNLGNALAHAGKIQEAIQSYAHALAQNPDDDDARFNKEYLEKQLEKQQQDQQNQQNNQQNQAQQQSDSQQQNQDNSQSQDNQNPDNQDQQNSEQQQESTQQDSEQEQAQPDADDASEQTLPQEIDENQEKSPFNQEEQQILNRLRPDPYRVLRYRLQQQARQK